MPYSNVSVLHVGIESKQIKIALSVSISDGRKSFMTGLAIYTQCRRGSSIKPAS